MSDNDVYDDVVCDVAGNTHTGNSDVISDGRLIPEINGKMSKTSKESPEQDSRGSNEDHSEADRSSGSAEEISEITEDIDDNEGYLSDYTISGSLEEKEQEALALERSSGLAQSTGEIVEYVESDESLGSATTLKTNDLLMTLQIRDVGLPLAQSSLIEDDNSTHEVKNTEDILVQNTEGDLTTEDQKHNENSFSASNIQIGSEVDKQDLSTDDFKDVEDSMHFLRCSFESNTDQKRYEILHTTEAESEMDLEAREQVERRFSRDCFTKVEDDQLFFQHEDEVATADGHHNQITRTFQVAGGTVFEQRDFNENSLTDDFRNDEGVFPPENDRAVLNRRDQQHLKHSFTAQFDSGLDWKQPEFVEVNIESDDIMSRNFSPWVSSDTNETLHQDRSVETLNAADHRQEQRENPGGNEDFVDGENEVCFGETFIKERTQDGMQNIKPEDDLFDSPDQFDTEPNQIQDDKDNHRGLTVSRNKLPDDGISSDHIPHNPDSLVQPEEKSANKLDIKEKATDGQIPTNNPKQNLVVLDTNDHQESVCSKVDVDGDLMLKEIPDVQKFAVSNADKSVQTEHADVLDKNVTPKQSEPNNFVFSSGNPSVPSVTAHTPDCMQLELLSKSAANVAERQLELVQNPATSNTWPGDEEKNKLLCLLDSRRRTELDKDNWQLARHIEDEMALVKDAELDDLENVQVSVKVCRICWCIM